VSATLEQAEFTGALNRPVGELTELPSSAEARAIIDACEERLMGDPEVREWLYGQMGVVRTELTWGYSVNGHQVAYKDERRQLCGAYKGRGGSLAMYGHEGETPVAYSTGNHAYATCLGAPLAGCNPAVIFAPDSMSEAKVEVVEPVAGELHHDLPTFRDAEQAARELAEQPGYFLVEPFGSPEVVVGQCTLGEELVDDLVMMGLTNKEVIIPVATAGAGQLAGYAVPLKRAKERGIIGEGVQIVAVQPEGCDTLQRAVELLQSGRRAVDLYAGEEQDKSCDALAIGEQSLSPLTLAIAADPAYVAGFFTVSDLQIARAMSSLRFELHGGVESSSALSRAFADSYTAGGSSQPEDKRPVFILPVSGGNVSPQTVKYFDAIEREAARIEFADLSGAYATRKVFGEDEVVEHQEKLLAELNRERVLQGKEPLKKPSIVDVPTATISGPTHSFRTAASAQVSAR
jgi:threonine dehydratase